MPVFNPTLTRKVRTKLMDHLDTVLVGEMITERFQGPFVALQELEKEIDRRAKRFSPKSSAR